MQHINGDFEYKDVNIRNTVGINVGSKFFMNLDKEMN